MLLVMYCFVLSVCVPFVVAVPHHTPGTSRCESEA
ncbi:hypothetical protein NQ318_001414 [Aromia moschata]|uniref:Uncharacterized protein n=1 Tax=Aromia moschata TaxID=1265417 RepID=A0AAV8YVA5_9CUCU|nr:hypothetical protein NQ318_001414 [Aromia moschata]